MAEKIQELIRVVDATLQNVSHDGLVTGQTGIKFVKFLLSVDNIEQFVGEEFHQHLQQQVLASENKNNQRAELKKVLMYPKFAYDPWIPLTIDQNKLRNVHQFLNTIPFKLNIIDGKIYAVPTHIPNLVQHIFDSLKEAIHPQYKVNTLSQVTLVNSDVIASINGVYEFLNNYQDEFTLTFGQLKSTTSNDWCVFSSCLVIEISSDYIQQFLHDFNKKYDKALKPSTHFTFAVVPRSLF